MFSQRKAAKSLVSIDSATNCSNCLSFIAFFFGIRATKKKALQKRNGVFSPARRAPTFEKVGQNNRLVCANIVRDKSKFANIINGGEQFIHVVWGIKHTE